MNILFFTNTYLPQVTGLARAVETLSGALRARGHRVTIVAPTFGDTATRDATDDVVRIPAVPVYDTGLALPLVTPITARLLQLPLLLRPCDLVHTHGFAGLGDAALSFARGRRRPIVFTHHTHHLLYERMLEPRLGNRAATLIGTTLAAKAVAYAKKVDAIVALGTDIQEQLQRCGVRVPIRIIPNGIPLQRFARGDRNGFRRRLGYGDNEFVVGSVGRLSPEKNLPLICQAVELLRRRFPLRLLVVGDGPLRQALATRGVDCTGPLAGQALVDALHAMDVFAFASLADMQSVAITEALAAGVPVAALPGVSCIRDVVDETNGNIARDNSAGALAAAIVRARRAAGNRFSLQRYSIESVAAQTEQLYITLQRLSA